MGGFHKGMTKTGGRQKGTKNKNTQVADSIVTAALKYGNRDFKKIWDQLKPKEQMDYLVRFLPFSIPQMARVETEAKSPTSITVNMIAATPQTKEIDNTINIEHEEIDD